MVGNLDCDAHSGKPRDPLDSGSQARPSIDLEEAPGRAVVEFCRGDADDLLLSCQEIGHIKHSHLCQSSLLCR